MKLELEELALRRQEIHAKAKLNRVKMQKLQAMHDNSSDDESVVTAKSGRAPATKREPIADAGPAEEEAKPPVKKRAPSPAHDVAAGGSRDGYPVPPVPKASAPLREVRAPFPAPDPLVSAVPNVDPQGIIPIPAEAFD